MLVKTRASHTRDFLKRKAQNEYKMWFSGKFDKDRRKPLISQEEIETFKATAKFKYVLPKHGIIYANN